MTTPISRASLVAKRHGRALAPAIRAYKADPHHAEEGAKKKQGGGGEQQLEQKKAPPAAEGSAALQRAPATRAMMMSPLLGSSLDAFFPMLRHMDAMMASDPFFSRASTLFDDPFFAAGPARRLMMPVPPAAANASAAALAQPQLLPLDISETDAGYVIKADLPGFHKSDVKVEVSPDGQYLTISGERSEERREGGGDGNEAAPPAEGSSPSSSRPLRVERRSWSSWSRSLALSPDVDVDAVKASLKDGVLQVQLPKLPPPPADEDEAPPAKTIAVE